MNFNTTPTRQELSEAMAELPAEMLPELANFLEYLRFKVHASVGEPIASPQTVEKGDNFLLSIAGLGESEEIDLSERDKETRKFSMPKNYVRFWDDSTPAL